MTSNTQPGIDRPWTPLQKIAFRFFFVFLSLQVLTENFMGNLFGDTLFIWQLGEKIFVQPCLWLNRHFFHFKYMPQTWTTFSGSLHTIRDTVYLLLACLTCIVWSIPDKKRTNYNKLYYWFSQCLVVGLSCISFVYGIIKLFPVQMPSPSVINLYRPVGDLSPFELLWTTFGYGKPYQVFSGFFEVSGAILILFKRTRVAGLFVLASVMINVIVLNYTYQIGVLTLSFYLFLVILFLLAPFCRQLFRFFFSKEPASLYQYEYVPARKSRIRWPVIIAVLLLATSFTLSIRSAYSRYSRTSAVDNSRKYALVKNYVINNDSLQLLENDTTRWRIWSERISGGKRFVTIAFMKAGSTKTYNIDEDSSKHILILHPFNQQDTSATHFVYADLNKVTRHLEGFVNQQKIAVDLLTINPGATLSLLKTKRTIIIFDDESDSQ
jgi:hypothetical protein